MGGLMSDLVICRFTKSMVRHDTECPYWDQVSLNNTKPNQSLLYCNIDKEKVVSVTTQCRSYWTITWIGATVKIPLDCACTLGSEIGVILQVKPKTIWVLSFPLRELFDEQLWIPGWYYTDVMSVNLNRDSIQDKQYRKLSRWFTSTWHRG